MGFTDFISDGGLTRGFSALWEFSEQLLRMQK